jgi:hypothetical protein
MVVVIREHRSHRVCFVAERVGIDPLGADLLPRNVGDQLRDILPVQLAVGAQLKRST